jgi:membrane protein
LGETGGQAVQSLLAGASSKSSGHLAAVVAIVLVLFAAVGVVAQLKDAMNTIWNVEDSRQTGIWWYIRSYLISGAGVLALGLLLTIALVLSAALSAISGALGVDASTSAIWQVLNFVVSLLVLAVMFGMLFKWFPDTKVRWRDVWLGSLVTAILFNIGKFLIGWYVGRQGFESTYGAAASIIVLLVWVYYSAQILLFGAELTHAYATAGHSGRKKDANASTPHSADTTAKHSKRPARGP